GVPVPGHQLWPCRPSCGPVRLPRPRRRPESPPTLALAEAAGRRTTPPGPGDLGGSARLTGPTARSRRGTNDRPGGGRAGKEPVQFQYCIMIEVEPVSYSSSRVVNGIWEGSE